MAAVKSNQPGNESLPSLENLNAIKFADPVEQFKQVVENIGGTVVEIENVEQINDYVREHFKPTHKLVTTAQGIESLEIIQPAEDPHDFEMVEFALLNAVFGVAENGAVWLTQQQIQVRVLAFICQHLAVLLHREDIVHNMNEAYARIGETSYPYALFIAGPSKTADIEQSLVLGAHGARSMTIFLMK